jgi:exonuclease SbcC
LRKQEAEAEEHLKAEETLHKNSEKSLEQARAVVIERRRKLPKALRTRAELNKVLTKSKSRLEQLLQALESAMKDEAETRQEHAEAKAAAGGAESSLKIAAQRSQKASERFSRRLKTAGFSGPDGYGEAKLTERAIDELARAIDEYEAGLKAARLRLTRARQTIRGKRKPDVSKFLAKAKAAEASCDAKIAETAEIRKEQERLAGLTKELVSTEREIEKMEKRYYVTGKIADVANGKNAKGITFQRFVLGTLLDEVLAAATGRLKLMSHGRYDLQRAVERSDRRLAGGLDLEVFDTFTGYARPVSTLSGGETFLASLSLALGLADVVQARAGGIHLETVFIDEGFGSLDPEALDLALRTLMDLQKGNRLVGIISHVPELKERIDVRLEVTRTTKGSSVRFRGV